MKRFLIIDGNGIMHRAYHALPGLTADGEVVNAVYGFFSMLLTVLEQVKPDYLAVCFDRSKPTIRQSMYAGYHAHRPAMANDFSLQFGKVEELLTQMRVPIFFIDGYEGDDCIGTLAAKSQDSKFQIQNSFETIILSGDRDMLQLVNDHTKVLMPLTGISKTQLFDSAAVEEKYGVKPEQFIDYKALIGDASDGYPGVTGIGPKTAANLLQQYQTFENLYQHVGELPEKVGLKLATDAEQAALAKKLATIVTDAPLQFNLEQCNAKQFNLRALREGFGKYHFKSLITRLEKQFPEAFVENEQMELI